MTKKDPWCDPVEAKSGKKVSGAAAREVRIAAAGGMEQILEDTVRDAVSRALDRAQAVLAKPSVTSPPRILRLVQKAA